MITKEKFEKFVRLQASGVMNMISSEVQHICGITKEEHMDIMKNYSSYSKDFNISVDDFREVRDIC